MKRLDVVIPNDGNEYKRRLTVALKAANVCVFEVDVLRQQYTFLENAEDIFGVSGADILRDLERFSGLPRREYWKAVSSYFSHPDDVDVIAQAFDSVIDGQSASCTVRMKACGSQSVWCKLDVVPIVEDGRTMRTIGAITDISDLKGQYDALEEKTHLDGFTGLYNKSYTIEAIQQVLDQAPDRNHALLLLDIDNFKNFNDTNGHLAGDRMIAATASALTRRFRRVDLVGRFGGDEFTVFIKDLPSTAWLQERMSTLTKVREGELQSTNSIGVALCPRDGTDVNTLFDRADQALYRAKKEKCRVVFWTPEQ